MKKLIYSLFAMIFLIAGCNDENMTKPDTLQLTDFKEAGLIPQWTSK